MGGSSYSSSTFDSTIGAATRAGRSSFLHDASIKAGVTAVGVHADLDPKLVAGTKSPHAGKVMRESRDSDAHPTSVAVAVLFDVTGSVGRGPRVFIEKMGPLMSLIIKKGYLTDPQILFGAIGDETSDRVPLQIGQFESGNEADQSLSKVYVEGGGGGQHFESYELAMYFMARHTSADCWEKRGEKGYLFIVGDEMFRPEISRGAVERIIGDALEADMPTEDLLTELREHYEVYWIMPNCSSYYDLDITCGPLSKTFDQNFIRLEKIEEIAELVAATIGVSRGFNPKDIVTDLVDAGLSKAGAARATSALAKYTAATSSLARKTATVDGTLATAGSDSIERL